MTHSDDTEVSLVFSCCFKALDISHGSVATHLRCGGIFHSIITNSPNIGGEKFENWSIFDKL